MKIITKFPLATNHNDPQTIMLPAGAEILTAQVTDTGLHLWAIVDTEAPPVPRAIRVFGSGQPLAEEQLKYAGSVQMNGGVDIWHVFEQVKGKAAEDCRSPKRSAAKRKHGEKPKRAK